MQNIVDEITIQSTNKILAAKVKQAADDFEKFIICLVENKIRRNYENDISKYVETLDSFLKKKLNEKDFKKINNFIHNFQLRREIVLKIIGMPLVNNKRVYIVDQVLDEIENRGEIKRLGHRNIKHKSGKTFTCCNCYYLTANAAEKYFNIKAVFNTNSSFYTKRQHKLIDKYIFKYNNKATEEVSEKEISQQDICHINPVQKEISQLSISAVNTSSAATYQQANIQPAPIVKQAIMKKNDDIIDEKDVLSPNSVIFQTKLRKQLQSVIDKGYISPKCGRRLWSYIYNNENVQFNMTQGGYVYSDSGNVENTTKRAKVLMFIFNEYSKCMSEKNKEKLQNDISAALLNLKTQNVDISVYFTNKQKKEVV